MEKGGNVLGKLYCGKKKGERKERRTQTEERSREKKKVMSNIRAEGRGSHSKSPGI